MKRRSAILIFVFLVGGVAFPQSSEQDPKFSSQSVSAEEQQAKLIREELAQLKGHPWAGEYFYGDGLGVNVSLALAPDAGFAFTWHGCLGLYDVNYGPVEWKDGKIKLVFSWPNHREGFEGIASELVPVRWGKRHYLVAMDEMVSFANAVECRIGAKGFVRGTFGQVLTEAR